MTKMRDELKAALNGEDPAELRLLVERAAPFGLEVRPACRRLKHTVPPYITAIDTVYLLCLELLVERAAPFGMEVSIGGIIYGGFR